MIFSPDWILFHVSKVMITKRSPIGSATRKTKIVNVANGVSCSDMAEFPLNIMEEWVPTLYSPY